MIREITINKDNKIEIDTIGYMIHTTRIKDTTTDIIIIEQDTIYKYM